mmetsp:Transcript_19883/g.50441  ORF Transcript_19883/g.50441 Transcript_19883/m.50441 type:complete len:448 (-) Transcript_19883:704-2047(-)
MPPWRSCTAQAEHRTKAVTDSERPPSGSTSSSSIWGRGPLPPPPLLGLEVGVLALRVVGRPHDQGRVHAQARAARRLEVVRHHLGCRADDVLPLDLLQHAQRLQRGDGVIGADGGALTQLLDGDGALVVAQHAQQLARPVAVVRGATQVGQRALGRAHLALNLGQLVRHGDEELAVALALVRGEAQDAGQVVPLLAALLLAEVAHHVRAALVDLAQDVEQEEVDVVVERLVVEEQLGQEAQVLAERLLALAVNLEHAHVAVAVDLLSGRVARPALVHVAQHLAAALEERQRVLAKVQLLAVLVLWREGREVPRVHHVAPQLNLVNVLDLCELLVLAQRVGVKVAVVAVAIVVVQHRLLLLFGVGVGDLHLHRGQVKLRQLHPLIHAPVVPHVVHVVLPAVGVLHGAPLLLPPLNDLGSVVLLVLPHARRLGPDLQRVLHLSRPHVAA